MVMRPASPRHRGLTRWEELEPRLLLFAATSDVIALPEVTNVQISSTAWSPSFVSAIHAAGLGDSGYSIPVGTDAQLTPLPWVNIDRIALTFNKDIVVQQSDLTLAGVSIPQYSFSGFSYDPDTFTATWTLPSALGRDNLLLVLDGHSATGVRDTDGNLLDGEWTVSTSVYPSGDGATGGDFAFAFNVLPANPNVDTVVNGLDIAQIASQWLQTGLHAGDVNGDGVVNGLDIAAVASHWLVGLSSSSFQTPTATALSASALSVSAGQSVDLTATVTSVAPYTLTPSEGTITFLDGNTPLGIVSVVGGQATLAGVVLPIGSHAISAHYDDSQGNFASSETALQPNSPVFTIVGNGNQGYSGDNGPASAAMMDGPQNVATDAAGNIYIADEFNNVIRRVDYATHQITTIAGTGVAGFTGDNDQATAAQLNLPTAITFDANGNLLIADQGNSAVRRVDHQTGIITTIAGTGVAGYSGDNDLATAAQLSFPRGVVADVAGNIYISDSDNDVVRMVDHTTGVITTIAGTGIPGFSGDNGQANVASLFSPQGLALDAAGNLLIADRLNARIRELNLSTGVITTIAGTNSFGYSGDNGLATAAQLNRPSGVALDAVGNIFIADVQNYSVRRVDAVTGIITTVAGTGVFGYSGDNGPATSATFNRPSGVTVDAAGDILIADFRNNVIREIPSGKIIVTVIPVADAASQANGAFGVATVGDEPSPSSPTATSGTAASVLLTPAPTAAANITSFTSPPAAGASATAGSLAVTAALVQAATPVSKPTAAAIDAVMAEETNDNDSDLSLWLS